MTFTVVYLPGAEQQLAELWLNAPDHDAVTDASDRIDRVFQTCEFYLSLP